jgi:hypothetical protein
LIFSLATLQGYSQKDSTKPTTNNLLGTWVIDLRPTPTSEPYLKDFKFTKIEGKMFDGEFYGYPFQGGFLNTDWDKIVGMSLNENRKILIPRRGEKKN